LTFLKKTSKIITLGNYSLFVLGDREKGIGREVIIL
jgi:hypothetical protein